MSDTETSILVLRPGHVTLAELRRIHDAATPTRLQLDASAYASLRASQAAVQDIVSQEDAVVYGINTGFGKLASTRIAHDRLAELQRNLVLSHSVGTGDPLPDAVVRLILATKAISLARGHSGVRPELVDALLALANADVLPVIPAQGSVGASGDLAPLAHLACVLIGEGHAKVAGRVVSGAEALRAIGQEPFVLGPKEGLALLNGTQVSTALALAGLFGAEDVFSAALVSGCLSLEAVRGSVKPFDARIHEARGQPGQIAVAAAVRALLAGSAIDGSHPHCGRVQDPYSIRCIPQVMGACLDNLKHAARVLAIEANAASDNPLVFTSQQGAGSGAGEVISGGNFHAEPVAFAADIIALAVAEIGAMAERRLALLLDPGLSGLPAFLVPDSGVNSGFMIAQVTAAALAAENQCLANPSSVTSLPTSANQEDHVSMATYGARRLADMVRNAAVIVGIEAMAAAQGMEFARRPMAPVPTEESAPCAGNAEGPAGGTWLASSDAIEAELVAIRQRVDFLDRDRYLAPDIEAMRGWAQQTDWPAPLRACRPSQV